MGSKAQRQNQHVRKIMRKIAKFQKKGWPTVKMEKELAYCTGGAERPTFKSGRDTDPRLKKFKI